MLKKDSAPRSHEVPFCRSGAEEKIMQEEKKLRRQLDPLQVMIQSSGKLVLIDKLLPKLKQGGHKVLLGCFSSSNSSSQ